MKEYLHYLSTKLANAVWGFIDSFAFRSVGHLLEWFQQEAQKDALANILLKDPDLKDDLNYGEEDGDSLNYGAVAKAGVVVYADFIHSNCIETGYYTSGVFIL